MSAGPPAPKKQKPTVEYRKCVICANSIACKDYVRCYEVMQDMACAGNADRAGYKKIYHAATTSTHQESNEQQIIRSRLLAHVPPAVGWVLQANMEVDHYAGNIHFPPQVTALISQSVSRKRWPKEVPAMIAQDISSTSYGAGAVSYTDIDRLPNGSYTVVPNFTWKHIREEWSNLPLQFKVYAELEDAEGGADRSARKRQREDMEQWVRNHPQLAANRLEEEKADRINQQEGREEERKKRIQAEEDVKKMRQEQEEWRKEMQELKKEKEQLINDAVNAVEAKEAIKTKMEKEFDDLLQKHGGIGRHTLTSDAWHKNHPDAAKTMFGFTWDETKEHLDSLFADDSIGDAPTREHLTKNKKILPFEKCLIALMRMKMAYVCLLLFWCLFFFPKLPSLTNLLFFFFFFFFFFF